VRSKKEEGRKEKEEGRKEGRKKVCILLPSSF
jgi:hypothetical protein